jgi:PqqD family protein of HPr-rel-A system
MAGPVYAADHREAYLTVELEGLFAIFHRPSGITHVLAPPAPEIIEALADAPANAGELLQRLSARFDIAEAESLEARLSELETAGLVWRL